MFLSTPHHTQLVQDQHKRQEENTEEGFERIISSSYSIVTWQLTIGLDSVLKTVNILATNTGLDTGLFHVD
jgi:hypothetical protein